MNEDGRDSSTLIQWLLAYSGKEGVAMPYTMQDFNREVKAEIVEGLTTEELLQAVDGRRIPLAELLGRLPMEELERLLRELKERLLSPEEL